MYNSGNFVGVFAKLLKGSTSFVMSICLSVHPDQLGYNCTDLYEFWNWSIFRKFVQVIQVRLQSEKNNGCFTWRPMYIYIIYCSILLGMRQKLFLNFCDENCAVCENIWKNQTGYRRQYKTGHAQCMSCNKATDTHPEYAIPIYCFSTAKVVMQTRLKFTFTLILPVLFP